MGDGHLVLGDKLVDLGHEELGDRVNLDLHLDCGDVADCARHDVDFVNEELRDLSCGNEVINRDTSGEDDVDEVHLNGKLSCAVESRPELKVGGTVDSYILVSLRGGETMQISAGNFEINDRVGSILGRHAWEGNVDHAGSQSGIDTGWELISVNPALNASNFEERAQEGVNGEIAEEDLELGRLGSILVGHVSEGSGPFGLTNSAVVHDALGSKLERSIRDNGCSRCLPVEIPILGAWNKQIAIHGGELGIQGVWNSRRQSISHSILNQVNDGALEEDFESSSEVRPDVAPDLDVDVVAVDVDENIDSAHSRHNVA